MSPLFYCDTWHSDSTHALVPWSLSLRLVVLNGRVLVGSDMNGNGEKLQSGQAWRAGRQFVAHYRITLIAGEHDMSETFMLL